MGGDVGAWWVMVMAGDRSTTDTDLDSLDLGLGGPVNLTGFDRIDDAFIPWDGWLFHSRIGIPGLFQDAFRKAAGQ